MQVITLESIDVCCMAWYIKCISKASFYRQATYVEESRRSHNHMKLYLKKPRKAT